MAEGHEIDIQKHVRTYLVVFTALAGLTIITVAVSYLHMRFAAALAVALMIAAVKASLVACYFMHLISERKAIYALLCLTSVFFVVLLLWPAMDEGLGMGQETSPTAPIVEHAGHQ